MVVIMDLIPEGVNGFLVCVHVRILLLLRYGVNVSQHDLCLSAV